MENAHLNFLTGLSAEEASLRLRVRFCATCCLILSPCPGTMVEPRIFFFFGRAKSEVVYICLINGVQHHMLDWPKV